MSLVWMLSMPMSILDGERYEVSIPFTRKLKCLMISASPTTDRSSAVLVPPFHWDTQGLISELLGSSFTTPTTSSMLQKKEKKLQASIYVLEPHS